MKNTPEGILFLIELARDYLSKAMSEENRREIIYWERELIRLQKELYSITKDSKHV